MSDRIFVSTRKGLFTIDRKRKAWSITNASFLGDNVTLAMHDERSGNVYAALDHGHFGVKLQRSTDGGDTWEETAAPQYPELPEGYEPKPNPMSGKVVPWTLKLIWALEPGGRHQEGLIWCGTLPGGLFRSEDHGESWEMIRPLWDMPEREEWFGGGRDWPGIHSVVVDPRDADHVTIGVSCGGAWVTHDGGQTWRSGGKGMRAEYMPPEQAYDVNIQDPHLVVQCHASPDHLWVQHHNGIFRSTDGAESWSEITDVAPSAFGFAVAVHPELPDTAWFVPALKDEKRIPVDGRLVVNRTRDGGETFEQLTEGLPQEHAYDIVFRHALDVDGSGDRLVFGSTTGALFISEDGGDSWACLSTHLPPIHATRFVRG